MNIVDESSIANPVSSENEAEGMELNLENTILEVDNISEL